MLPFELTKDTPYLALSGELWSVFYEYFNKNWPCYKGFLLYVAWFKVPWASYQIRKIAGCACAGNGGNVSPRRQFQRKPLVSDPGMHHGTCVTHVPWCMSGSLTCDDGENVPGIPGACAPAILRIWQEAHWRILIDTFLCLILQYTDSKVCATHDEWIWWFDLMSKNLFRICLHRFILCQFFPSTCHNRYAGWFRVPLFERT